MVIVNSFGKDTCVLCDKDNVDCFEADFGKLKGPMCRGCFTRICKTKTPKKNGAAQQQPPNGQSAGAKKVPADAPGGRT